MRCSIDITLTEGGLRSETEIDVTSGAAPGDGSLDFVVPNPGTDLQDELRIDLTGAFSSVKLTNVTADPTDLGVFLEFGGNQGVAGVEIDTDAFAAVRDAVNVIGLISQGGHERWLPLVPGDNTIRIEPQVGDATVRFRHFPFIN